MRYDRCWKGWIKPVKQMKHYGLGWLETVRCLRPRGYLISTIVPASFVAASPGVAWVAPLKHPSKGSTGEASLHAPRKARGRSEARSYLLTC